MEGGCESGNRLLVTGQSRRFDQCQTFFDGFARWLGGGIIRVSLEDDFPNRKVGLRSGYLRLPCK